MCLNKSKGYNIVRIEVDEWKYEQRRFVMLSHIDTAIQNVTVYTQQSLERMPKTLCKLFQEFKLC